ncbi:MAG: PH domain-containing protein [Planctomycetes bacterium]|nr:PH domain-containing protein [Planctomycetota bacterium]
MEHDNPEADRGNRIREIWPSVARVPAVANLGKLLTNTIVLAPLGWLIMAGVYFGKVLPFLAVRYRLTDKRIMILRGWKGTIGQQVPLTDIDDVQLDPASIDNFFRSADLKIMHDGNVAMTLKAVPDAEAFRHAIIDARNAWVKVKQLPFIPASATK